MGFTAMLGDGSASVLPMRKLLLLRVGLVSLKFCVCWGEDDKARTEDSRAGASQTTKDAMSLFRLGKMLKGGVSLESQRVPGASISVPVSGASQERLTILGVWLPHVSHCTDCLCCPLDVSDRQHIPAPCFHPHPIMAGPGSSLLPFPWLHCL